MWVISADIWMVDTASAHVPNLTNMASVLDLLATCSISILSNVLDFDTYRHPNQPPPGDNALQTNNGLTSDQVCQMELFDYNSKLPDDRVGCVYVRGLALDLLEWFSKNYLLVEPNGKPTADTYGVLMDNLSHQAYMVWLAKKKAADQRVKGAPHCTLSALERQLRGLFREDSVAHLLLDQKLNEKSELETMMHMNFAGWTVMQRSKIRHTTTISTDIMELGMTSLDRKYAKGCLNNFDIAKVK